MAVLLDVFALPRAQGRSRTRRIRDAFLKGFGKGHPEAQVQPLDLVAEHSRLPTFDEWDIQAKFEMAYGEGHLDPRAAERWEALSRLTNQLHQSAAVVISAPMWNFSVPWYLKRWIDCVVQAKLTFDHVDGQFLGLLTGRPAVVITTRDGRYQPGSPAASMDFFLPYLRTVLGLMGLGPIHELVAEPMALEGPEVAARVVEETCARAVELGRSLQVA